MSETGAERTDAARPDAGQASSEPAGLWPGDTGVLREDSRRALLQLVKGPYLASTSAPALWSALLVDERAVSSRLNELFLDLVVDRERGFAFVRNIETTELQIPRAVRTEALTFLDTAMLLVLRRLLLGAEGEGRVIVGADEVNEQLQVYRSPDRDESDFARRLGSAWTKMQNKLRVIQRAGEDRFEISPVLRLIVDADQVRAIDAEYRRLAGQTGAPDGESFAEDDSGDSSGPDSPESAIAEEKPSV